MKPALVIHLVANRLAAWQLPAHSAPHRLSIQGEEHLDVSTAAKLAAAYADLAELLQEVEVGHIHWLVDQQGRELWREGLPGREDFPGRPVWQVLAWEWLADRLGLSDASPEVLEGELLPWLAVADAAYEHRQLQDALARRHHGESARLANERAQLEDENRRLREQNAALRRADAELLASYLPALFHRAFTVIGASDLALLCGRVEPLPIPNPYPEPSEETLHVLQRDFRALPDHLQRQIVGFVARLPQRQQLQPRTEMRELLRKLEHG